MAELSFELTERINALKQQTLNIIHQGSAAAYQLNERLGETAQTLPFFEELEAVMEEARMMFNRFNQLQVRVAEAQPAASPDLMALLIRVIEFVGSKIPAWERSIEEVRVEFDLS